MLDANTDDIIAWESPYLVTFKRNHHEEEMIDHKLISTTEMAEELFVEQEHEEYFDTDSDNDEQVGESSKKTHERDKSISHKDFRISLIWNLIHEVLVNRTKKTRKQFSYESSSNSPPK
ncbi:4661_t:CDS:2 [Dentiscutata erythropus]|uniref:4661_t:CDS:1 n=1 Tax=Dentiscutata erythropus TaxID=1348616 RepID=A0A9N9DSH2_9GLOM|nr:4661_t:CDS:2 [Dentiscutata erythropus]